MVLSMLWNNLMCLDYFNLKSMLWKVYGSNHDSWTFDFIKISTQIINKFLKSLKKQKKLIYAKMVKVLW
jgi:alpha-galactosidase/6-phospho-beta-glucosidase family protein